MTSEQTSAYQSFKIIVVDIFGLSNDAIHIHIGLVVFFVAVLLWKKGRITVACILPVMLLAAGMEAADLYDDYRSVGYLRWANSTYDVVNTLFWPAIIILFTKLKRAETSDL